MNKCIDYKGGVTVELLSNVGKRPCCAEEGTN